jgi:hypothetical protein
VVKKLKTKVLRGWTDYPLCKNSVILGPTPDIPYQKCPLRKCIVTLINKLKLSF